MSASFQTDRGPQAFLDAYEARLRPLQRQHGETYWRFSLTGDGALQRRLALLENDMSALHAHGGTCRALQRWLADGVDDPLVRRQLELVAPDFRRSQVDRGLRERIIELNLEVEEAFTTSRPTIDGRRWSSNELDRGLLSATDDRLRRQIWEATRDVGRQVKDRVVELARLRNRQATELGFSDYYQLELDDQEMDADGLFGILDDLRARTDAPWTAQKLALDDELGALRGKPADQLQPWDYRDRFLQSVPHSDASRTTDPFFTLRAIKDNTLAFYRGIGLPADDLWRAGDLLPRDGKCPHAFCIGIDNPVDVRVLCNLDGTARWMETALHEFGHAVYNRGVSSELPWLLREPAHTFITEAVAMFFGRLVKSGPWLRDVAGVSEEMAAAAAAEQADAQLVFARWALLVTSFERSLYADPGQDLDAAWWTLAEAIQGLRKPDGWDGPDWASKVHIACYPAYYQNYLLGELLASQFRSRFIEQAGAGEPNIANRPEVGAFFGELFAMGQRLPWGQTVTTHTGTPLSASHWVDQFARGES